MKEFNATALFRLSVLGPLVSRDDLERGDLQKIIREVTQKEYAIPAAGKNGAHCTVCHTGFTALMPDFPKGCAECHAANISGGHWINPTPSPSPSISPANAISH